VAGDQLLVIGVGNRFRGDDAAGLVVAERLKRFCLPNVDVKLLPSGGLGLIDAWQEADSVIIVDAVRGTGVAGGIVRVSQKELGRLPVLGTVSSHGFGVGEAMRMAQALGVLPDRLMIYGIEAKNFGPGSALSPEVAEAVEHLVQLIAQEQKCTS